MAFLDLHTEQIQRLVAAEPVVRPGTANVGRRIPTQRITLYPAERNVRPGENLNLVGKVTQRAPDPIRQGDTPARPARMPVVTFLSIASIRAVMANEFRIKAIAPNKTAATPRGSQHALVERANIRRPAAEAYGSLFTLDPPDRYALY